MELPRSSSPTPRRVGFAVAFVFLVLLWVSTGSLFFGLGVGMEAILLAAAEQVVGRRSRRSL